MEHALDCMRRIIVALLGDGAVAAHKACFLSVFHVAFLLHMRLAGGMGPGASHIRRRCCTRHGRLQVQAVHRESPEVPGCHCGRVDGWRVAQWLREQARGPPQLGDAVSFPSAGKGNAAANLWAGKWKV